ncbi:MAG: signal recognition particle-docking protein FtsY [Clostridia bacterium]|nr:signal recognition particle-docking protein FtsY [Clostridia bacterium]MBR2302811.1 signal recognition particle-docking protein FtsY [Clostridia bacterium]
MGFFKKIVDGLKKTKQNVGFKLKQLFKVGVFDDDFFDDLETLLLSSDVGASATMEIVDLLRDRLEEEKIIDPDQAMEELKDILMDMLETDPFEIESPAIIMVVGVNGVGKTTTIGKLASQFKNQGKSVLIAAADTFRAAASEQLEIWADRAGVRIVKHQEGSDPAAVVFDALSSAKSRKTDVILIDTAGRLHNKVNLMEELKKINRVISREYPDAQRKNLIVLDATTGQNALQQVELFNDAVNIDSIALTKLDGTAKGGVVIAIKEKFGIPVDFIGVGEGIDDLMPFDAESFVEGIL